MVLKQSMNTPKRRVLLWDLSALNLALLCEVRSQVRAICPRVLSSSGEFAMVLPSRTLHEGSSAMRKLKICIFGAGAIGGYLAVELALAGHHVCAIARGTHLHA